MKRRLLKYKKYFLTGEWHVHTSYTDGKNSVDEYCQKAIELGIPLIAFTEHVRKNLTYDFNHFVDDIKEARKKYHNLIILLGCEAKVLDLKGNLDVSDEILEKCDIILAAFHSFQYKTKYEYLTALKNMIQNKIADIWAHPTLFAQENNLKLTEDDIKDLSNLCRDNGMIIERNRQYNLPNERFVKLAKYIEWINGGDVHSIEELKNE